MQSQHSPIIGTYLLHRLGYKNIMDNMIGRELCYNCHVVKQVVGKSSIDDVHTRQIKYLFLERTGQLHSLTTEILNLKDFMLNFKFH
jgi:hypothetical protein